PGFDALKGVFSEAEEATDELAVGSDMINRSDCHACHNEQVKTVGPAYLAVARKYADSDENIARLAQRIIEGGSGVWGAAMMTPHPSLEESDAREMVKYILSLDDDDGDEGGGAWHLGEKTVPPGFTADIPVISKEQPGVAMYLHLYSGDQPNA